MSARSRRKFLWLIRVVGTLLIFLVACWGPVQLLFLNDIKNNRGTLMTEWSTIDGRAIVVCDVDARWTVNHYSGERPISYEVLITFGSHVAGNLEYGQKFQNALVIKVIGKQSIAVRMEGGSVREVRSIEFGYDSDLGAALLREYQEKYGWSDEDVATADWLTGPSPLQWSDDGSEILCRFKPMDGYLFTGHSQIVYSTVFLAAWSFMKEIFYRSALPIVLLFIITSYRLWRWIDRGKCPKCGYDLRGSGADAGCPECGWGRGVGVVKDEG